MSSDELSLDDIFGRFMEEGRGAGGARREPFKFLDPYDREDRDIFFGRDAEAAELYRRFHLSSQLLVYGQSGTGKTSLIRCGLLARVPAEDALPVTVRLGDLPVADLEAALRAAGAEGSDPAAMVADLREKSHKPVVLILDQFEEPFILAPREERERLFAALASIARLGGWARMLIAMREEYIARLSELEPYLPSLFANRLRLERMRRGSAAELLTGPCGVAGVAIAKELADEVLDTLSREGEIELAYLQVYADKLWRSARARDAANPEIRKEDVSAAGDIGDVLGAFLEERLAAMSDGEICRRALKACVTPEGTRRAVGPTDLAVAVSTDGRLDLEAATALARRLTGERILREKEGGGEWELRHDSLAARISSWLSEAEKDYVEVEHALRQRLAEYKARLFLLDDRFLRVMLPHERKLCLDPEFRELVERSKRELKRRRRRRVTVLSGAAIVLIAALSGLSVWAMQSRDLAVWKGSEAESHRLAAEENAIAASKSAIEATQNAAEAEANALRAAESERRAVANALRAAENERKALAYAQTAAENARRAEENAGRAEANAQRASESEQRAVANAQKALAQQAIAEAERSWAEVLSANLREESSRNNSNNENLYRLVIEQCNMLLERDSGNSAVYYYTRAQAYAQIGDRENAIKDFKRTQKYSYGDILITGHLVYEYFASMKPAEAIALSEQYFEEFELPGPQADEAERAYYRMSRYTVLDNRAICEGMVGNYGKTAFYAALAIEALGAVPDEGSFYCTIFDPFIMEKTGKAKIETSRDEAVGTLSLYGRCAAVYSGTGAVRALADIAAAAPSYNEALYLMNIAYFQMEYRPADYGALALRFFLWRRFVDTSPVRRKDDPAAGLYRAFTARHAERKDPRFDELDEYIRGEFGGEYGE